MEWKAWNGKRVFVQLRSGAVYSGVIEDVDISDGKLIFITILDKYNERVTFVHTEIIKIKEEQKNG